MNTTTPHPPIVDFHVHAFPDALAPRALALLASRTGIAPAHDGTVAGLLSSMRRAGVSRALLSPIATKPSHFAGIRDWALSLRSQDLPLSFLLSVHPDDPLALQHVDETASLAFPGLKFHPYYQNFAIDDPRLFPLYQRISDRSLLAVFHCGYDAAFPHTPLATPPQILAVARRFPSLRLVVTHLGGWSDWDRARQCIIGQPIDVEISMSGSLPPEQLREMLLAHPADRLLFGSDAPWDDPSAALSRILALHLPPHRLSLLLSSNALRLLSLSKRKGQTLLKGTDPAQHSS